MPKPTPTPYSPLSPPGEAERESVHQVYEAIAPHFSLTRYKPWPLVSRFLASLPPNTLGSDSGAGNGKYVPSAREQGREVVASDMSWGLLSVARGAVETKAECSRGESGYDGWRARVFDWAISIAAIHHLSTPERRAQGVKALSNASALHRDTEDTPCSRFMIYVWAFEQGEGSKRKMGKRAAGEAREGGRVGHSAEAQSNEGQGGTIASETEDTEGISSGMKSLSTRSLPNRTSTDAKTTQQSATSPPPADSPAGPPVVAPLADGTPVVQDVSVPWVLQPKPGTKETQAEEPKVFHRYYHLFLRGESRESVESAARDDGYIVVASPDQGAALGPEDKWMRVVSEGWEADNWWLEGQVGVGPTRG